MITAMTLRQCTLSANHILTKGLIGHTQPAMADILQEKHKPAVGESTSIGELLASDAGG